MAAQKINWCFECDNGILDHWNYSKTLKEGYCKVDKHPIDQDDICIFTNESTKKLNQNQTRQTYLNNTKRKINYSYGPYNKVKNDLQIIRLTEGCPHNSPYCYEPEEIKIFEIPEIVKNKVQIIDMNLLCKKEALDIIMKLGLKRVNSKVIYYELVCGIDYRFLTKEIAKALKISRFKKIRLAWDWDMNQMYNIKKAIYQLKKVGYKNPQDIMIYMICNWDIPYKINCKKLDLCKVWNVQVCDCYYDGQTSPNIHPIKWSDLQIKRFRKKTRKHNQLVSMGIDPEYKR